MKKLVLGNVIKLGFLHLKHPADFQ